MSTMLRRSSRQRSDQDRVFGTLTSVRATRRGSPFVKIIRYTRENEIDLIVIATG